MKPHWTEGHVGELILFAFAIVALVAYLVALMAGKADQTLGAVVMAASGALGAFMQKRQTPGPQTTNVDTVNVDAPAPPAAPAPTRPVTLSHIDD